MFDLNTNEEKEMMKEEELREGSGTNTELSGTSSASSVVNAVVDESAGEFDFFPEPNTQLQLFPMSQAFVERVATRRMDELESLRLGSSQTSHHWLNLSVAGPSSASGLGSEQPPEQSNKQQQVRKSRRGPRSRSSQYRGVTFYRRTGRWESHIWDCGKQVYLGGFDTAHAAARAYDRAAIKFRGIDADINFNIADYEEDMNQMKNLNKEEFVHVLRRQSTGFARGSSRYRGVTLHKCGRLEAPLPHFLGNNMCGYIACRAYDKAAIQCNGREAVTNVEPSSYHSQIHFPPNFEGGGHNLDLNLGISMGIDAPKASSSIGVGESQTSLPSLQLPNGKGPMMTKRELYLLRSGQRMYGQPLASTQCQSSTLCSTLLPGRSGLYEVEKSGDKVEEEKMLSDWVEYKYRQGSVIDKEGGGIRGGTIR